MTSKQAKAPINRSSSFNLQEKRTLREIVDQTYADNADLTGAEIKSLYEAETKAYTDTQFDKLAGIEALATADQSSVEIKTAYETNAGVIQVDSSGLQTHALSTGIVAFATGGQAGATQLVSSYNIIATVTTAGDSVKLPTASTGNLVTIVNNGANSCNVFPNTSDNLGAGVNTAAALASGSNITYLAIDATNWEVI